MSISLSASTQAKFQFLRQGDRSSEPLQQLNGAHAEEKSFGPYAELGPGDLNKFVVIFDESMKGSNLSINKQEDPFVAAEVTPSDSTTSVARPPQSALRPTLFHSSGMWTKSKKSWCSKVDMRYLYYQHFLNMKKVSDYQLEVLTSVLNKAKRGSRMEDSIALSLFLHESSGLRSALDADVELFRKWHEGEFKGSLRKRFSSERMLFKGYVDQLDDHWRPLTSEELFELPILGMLCRTPAEIMQSPLNREIKGVNQRTYFNTLVHHVDNRDRGHTLY